MKKCNAFGFVGFRGVVGSVLIDRLIKEEDCKHIKEAYFFSTSAANKPTPKKLVENFSTQKALIDASDLDFLRKMDVIVSCQGSEFSRKIQPTLRESGWEGYWVDAASRFRLEENSVLILPPINQEQIDKALSDGKRDFIGANCSVSLLAMAIGGLLKNDMVEWISAMTYQAASGAGGEHLRELLKQFKFIGEANGSDLEDPSISVIELEKNIISAYLNPDFPKEQFSVPLAGSLIPFIDSMMENGQSREEWKGQVEANKLLSRTKKPIGIDGTCVRIGTLRCHAQGLTIKLNEDYSIEKIIATLSNFNNHVKVIPNELISSKWLLNPAQISGTLDIFVGRVRKMTIDPKMLNIFTVGDQLLWGAAEPLRCMVKQLSQN